MDSKKKKDRQGIMIAVGTALVAASILGAYAYLSWTEVKYDPKTLCPKDRNYAQSIVLVDQTDKLSSVQKRALLQILDSVRDGLATFERLTIYVLNEENFADPSPIFDLCNPVTGEDASFNYQNPTKLQMVWNERFGEPLRLKLDELFDDDRTADTSPILGLMPAEMDAHAQFDLGKQYYFGSGVEQNYAEAVKWYRLAAEQGNAEARLALEMIAHEMDAHAQFDLGKQYYFGQGVEQDSAEAEKWFLLAAEQGHAEAQVALAAMAVEGDVEQVLTPEIVFYGFPICAFRSDLGQWCKVLSEEDKRSYSPSKIGNFTSEDGSHSQDGASVTFMKDKFYIEIGEGQWYYNFTIQQLDLNLFLVGWGSDAGGTTTYVSHAYYTVIYDEQLSSWKIIAESWEALSGGSVVESGASFLDSPIMFLN